MPVSLDCCFRAEYPHSTTALGSLAFCMGILSLANSSQVFILEVILSIIPKATSGLIMLMTYALVLSRWERFHTVVLAGEQHVLEYIHERRMQFNIVQGVCMAITVLSPIWPLRLDP